MATSAENIDHVASFCDEPPESVSEGEDETDGVLSQDLIWKGKSSLRVTFINPDKLKDWDQKLTTETIIDWVNGDEKNKAWGEIMKFEDCSTGYKDDIDIRVEFADSGGSWSMVGRKANKVKRNKPTMMLNLSKEQCPRERDRRSLVIHVFGHALGMEHEHHRSDFWNVVEKHLCKDKMRNDPQVNTKLLKHSNKAGYGMDWYRDEGKVSEAFRSIFGRKNNGKITSSKYDPCSIMHCGFKVKWFKDSRYETLQHIKDAESLDETEKEYLEGIHVRKDGLAREPSTGDLDMLREAYITN